MHLAVEDDHPDIPDMRARKRPFLHLFHDTLQDGWMETQIDGSADYTVEKDQFSTPFQLEFFAAANGEALRIGHSFKPGFHLDVYFGKLARTSSSRTTMQQAVRSQYWMLVVIALVAAFSFAVWRTRDKV